MSFTTSSAGRFAGPDAGKKVKGRKFMRWSFARFAAAYRHSFKALVLQALYKTGATSDRESKWTISVKYNLS
jgi:hypothetical protein